MNLSLEQGEIFTGDFEHQARWYVRHADEIIARRYLGHLRETLRLLTIHPAMGRARRYRHPELKGLRSFRVNPPFQRHLQTRHQIAYFEHFDHGLTRG